MQKFASFAVNATAGIIVCFLLLMLIMPFADAQAHPPAPPGLVEMNHGISFGPIAGANVFFRPI
jgi:hypothetical protein